MGGWRKYEYKEYGSGDKTADGNFYHAFYLLIIIKISLAVIFIYSITENHISTPESRAVTQATLNLSQLTGTHTLTLKNGGADVITTKIDASNESGNITTIKDQTADVKINLTLNLAEVTLKDTSQNTLTATGTITTTKKVSNPTSALATSHDLTFTSTGELKQEKLGTGSSVKIGPNTERYNTLTLTATTDPVANQNGKPTNLILTLSAGTTEQLTLNASNNTLTLEGGIEGTLTYNSGNGNLTASITSVKYNLIDFHYTYKTKYNTQGSGHFGLINN